MNEAGGRFTMVGVWCVEFLTGAFLETGAAHNRSLVLGSIASKYSKVIGSKILYQFVIFVTSTK